MASKIALSEDTVLVAARNQVAANLGEDEVVILNQADGEYYGLDGVAARIWSLIQQPRTVAAIRDRVLRDYPDVDATRCTEDVVSFLDQLCAQRLAEMVDPAQAPASIEPSQT